MRRLIIVVFSLLLISPAFAAEQQKDAPVYGPKGNSFIFGIQGGYRQFDTDLEFFGNDIRNTGSVGFRLGYAIFDWLEIESYFDYYPATNDVLNLEYYIYGIQGGWNVLPDSKVTPYFNFGAVGQTFVSRFTSFDDTDPGVSYAAGLKWFIFPNTAIRFEARGVTIFDDNFTSADFMFGFMHYLNFTTGVDSDGDGIPDGRDKCPKDPEDKDGFQDKDGCPDPDNDGDKILDAKDMCPNDAEDFDSFQDKDGCPDVDNDEDGIPDAEDKCIGLAEDKDGFQDDDGCPEKDNDGDGIRDKIDECPNEPEDYNKFLDSDGCPDDVLQKYSGIIGGMQFAYNSTIIDERSYALLDQVASLLRDNKQVRLTVEGHTDSRGNAKYNKKLSVERAEAVRQYLISKGIDPYRIQIRGYGEERPIASNATETGRARNRRIVFNYSNLSDELKKLPRKSGETRPGKPSGKTKKKAKP